MSLIFRRTFASVGEGAAAAAAAGRAAATTSSSSSSSRSQLNQGRINTMPIHVRERRQQYERSPVARNLTPSQELRFQELRADGEFPGDEASAREAFLAAHDAWRSRIRGTRQVKQMPEDDKVFAVDADDAQQLLSSPVPAIEFADATTLPSAQHIAGQRIYLPNVQIRLMRNHTPPGQPYDTSIATFRIPPSMTKNDLRSYLSAVYNLPVTFIRTDNYIAPIKRIGPAGQQQRVSGSKKNYKRAIVGLLEPFHYPDDVAELDAIIASTEHDTSREASLRRRRAMAGKARREQWLNEQYNIDQTATGRKRSMMKMAKGWRWRAKTHDNQGNIVREIMKRRQENEHALEAQIEKLSIASSSEGNNDVTYV